VSKKFDIFGLKFRQNTFTFIDQLLLIGWNRENIWFKQKEEGKFFWLKKIWKNNIIFKSIDLTIQFISTHWSLNQLSLRYVSRKKKQQILSLKDMILLKFIKRDTSIKLVL
jgi:hypothetical protein